MFFKIHSSFSLMLLIILRLDFAQPWTGSAEYLKKTIKSKPVKSSNNGLQKNAQNDGYSFLLIGGLLNLNYSIPGTLSIATAINPSMSGIEFLNNHPEAGSVFPINAGRKIILATDKSANYRQYLLNP